MYGLEHRSTGIVKKLQQPFQFDARKLSKGNESFRPLFVGISWPSLWSWKVFNTIGILSSYFTKADDADEVGLIWGNRILRDILIPFKKEQNIPLILIGHSLGARLLTRALFSSPLISTEPTKSIDINRSDVDLVIGLEGAFSVRRFIYGEGLEGYPYANFSNYAKNYVFTWSKHDKANPVTGFYGARYIGGKYVNKYTRKFDLFSHYKIKIMSNDDTDKLDDNFLDKNFNRKFKNVESDGAKVSWENHFNSSPVLSEYSEYQSPIYPISIVDASELIYYHPYYKDGNAHNDIYTPGIAEFIWNCINNIQ